MLADRRLYVSRDGRLVEEADVEAAFMLAAKGHEIPAETVKRLGLCQWADGRVMQGAEPEPASVWPDSVTDEQVAQIMDEPPEPIMPPQSRRSRRKY
jgi:hypothetical protein